MISEGTVSKAIIEAARRLVGAPEGGQVHSARMDVREYSDQGESLVLLVDYGIGGIKKWVIPVGQIPPSVSPEAPRIEVERESQPSQAPPPVPPEITRPATERKRRRK